MLGRRVLGILVGMRWQVRKRICMPCENGSVSVGGFQVCPTHNFYLISKRSDRRNKKDLKRFSES